MRRALIVLGPLLVALAACGTESDPDAESTVPPETSQQPAKAPPKPKPVADGPCPYLTPDLVAQTNGQQVGSVKVSKTKPHPACFFYRPDGEIQLTVQVYVGTADVATALVDRAAPVDTSSPAELSGGWSGGSEATDSGAVFAVAKQDTAVAVFTNQLQSLKAKLIAEQTITNLGL